MSHEIRTPLTAISGIAEILQRDTLTEKQSKLVNTLHSSTATLKDIVNDILDFSKIESGELDLENKVFPLADLLDEIKALMGVNAKEKGLAFICDYEQVRNTSFFGDRLRLRQVLINLISNAVKFTAKGAVTVKVLAEGTLNQPTLRVEVSDTGIGIAKENLELIFERFKQADSSVSRKYGGTGLGLAISKNIVSLMGGAISVVSQPGEGSTFIVILPLKLPQITDENVEDGRALNKKLNDKIKSSLNTSAKILIAEDYEGNIVVLSYILDDMGCTYDIAKNGQEALHFWKQHHYDLILMDVQMPEMDGFTATTQIRSVETANNLRKTPIIGMTAHALVSDKDKCIAAGMDAYLPKPIVESDLKTQMLKYLNARKQAA